MKYLSIDKNPQKISYAVFDNAKLIDYGEKTMEYVKLTSDVLLSAYDKISELIKEHAPDVVLTNSLNDYKNMTKDIERIVEMRTVIKLASLQNKCIFNEFKTDGWEKRITFGKVNNKNKLDIINSGYNINLLFSQIGIANAIILGEGVAHNRLQIGID